MNDLRSFLAVLISLIAFLGTLGWVGWVCSVDARRRGQWPFLVTLLVFVSLPLRLLLGLLFSARAAFLPERRITGIKCTSNRKAALSSLFIRPVLHRSDP
jgi:hypothetical protein